MEQRAQPVIDLLQPELTEMDMGGVPVLEMKPKGWVRPAASMMRRAGTSLG